MKPLMERHFQNPEAAREWLERVRWPNGPICPHCGTFDHAYTLRKVGWYRCAEKACRKDFSVTLGTVMERSHIALNKWLIAFNLMCFTKKGTSAAELRHSLDLDHKSAWFLVQRICEAKHDCGRVGPLGGGGKCVEADKGSRGRTEKPLTSAWKSVPHQGRRSRRG